MMTLNLVLFWNKVLYVKVCKIMYKFTIWAWISNILCLDCMQFCHLSYRSFVSWCWGYLGWHVRVVIPSCVVVQIRQEFPDSAGQYVGLRPPLEWIWRHGGQLFPPLMVSQTPKKGLWEWGLSLTDRQMEWGRQSPPRKQASIAPPRNLPRKKDCQICI